MEYPETFLCAIQVCKSSILETLTMFSCVFLHHDCRNHVQNVASTKPATQRPKEDYRNITPVPLLPVTISGPTTHSTYSPCSLISLGLTQVTPTVNVLITPRVSSLSQKAHTTYFQTQGGCPLSRRRPGSTSRRLPPTLRIALLPLASVSMQC